MRRFSFIFFSLLIALGLIFLSSTWRHKSPHEIELLFSPENLLRISLGRVNPPDNRYLKFPAIIYMHSNSIPVTVHPIGNWSEYLHNDNWGMFVYPSIEIPELPNLFFISGKKNKDFDEVILQKNLTEAGPIVINKRFNGFMYWPRNFIAKKNGPEKKSSEINEDLLKKMGVDFLDIKIKNGVLEKFITSRNDIIADYGINDDKHASQVTGAININGEYYGKAKISFKGDWSDHFNGDQWSLKIKLKPEFSFHGMSYFSIQNDQVRNGPVELLFMETLRRANIIVPQYSHVYVKINGHPIGLMQAEERWHSVLQNSQRRKGNIYNIDDSELFTQWKNNLSAGKSPVLNSKNLFDSQYNPVRFQSFKLAEKSLEIKNTFDPQYQRGIGLLRGLQEGRLDPDQVFDMKTMAYYYAAIAWWYGPHALVPHNQHFYFNPVLDLMEPIGYDVNIIPSLWADSSFTYRYFDFLLGGSDCKKSNELCLLQKSFTRITESRVFWIFFEEALKFYSSQYENFGLKSDLIKKFTFLEELKHAAHLRPDSAIDFDVLGGRLKNLLTQKKFFSANPKDLPPEPRSIYNWDVLTTPIQAFIIYDKNHFYLNLENIVKHKINIDAIKLIYDSTVPTVLNQKNLVLPPTDVNSSSALIRLPIKISDIPEKVLVQVSYEAHSWWVVAKPYANRLEKNNFQIISLSNLLKHLPSAKLNFQKKEITLPANDFKISSSISIPHGWKLNISAGAILRFCERCILYTRGDVTVDGSKSHPVQMLPLENNWPGILMDNRDHTATVSNLIIRGMLKNDGAQPGEKSGFVIYGGAIRIDGLEIYNSSVEDALNLVRVDGFLKNVKIENTSSDAIDFDFSSTNLENILIANAGDDGLDFGTSTSIVKNLEIRGAGDKGISVGEASNVQVFNAKIISANIGVGVKDLSYFNADGLLVEKSKVGIAAYQKKKEFGGGRIQLKSHKILDCEKSFNIESGSNMSSAEESLN